MHCWAMGECSVNLHQPEGTASISSNSQLFKLKTQTQPPLVMFPMSTPTIAPSFPTQIPTPSINTLQPPPFAIQTSQAPPQAPLPAVSSHMPTQIVAEPPSSMNPLPDPHFASQMHPIFTTQASCEQEICEDVCPWMNSVSIELKG